MARVTGDEEQFSADDLTMQKHELAYWNAVLSCKSLLCAAPPREPSDTCRQVPLYDHYTLAAHNGLKVRATMDKVSLVPDAIVAARLAPASLVSPLADMNRLMTVPSPGHDDPFPVPRPGRGRPRPDPLPSRSHHGKLDSIAEYEPERAHRLSRKRAKASALATLASTTRFMSAIERARARYPLAAWLRTWTAAFDPVPDFIDAWFACFPAKPVRNHRHSRHLPVCDTRSRRELHSDLRSNVRVTRLRVSVARVLKLSKALITEAQLEHHGTFCLNVICSHHPVVRQRRLHSLPGPPSRRALKRARQKACRRAAAIRAAATPHAKEPEPYSTEFLLPPVAIACPRVKAPMPPVANSSLFVRVRDAFQSVATRFRGMFTPARLTLGKEHVATSREPGFTTLYRTLDLAFMAPSTAAAAKAAAPAQIDLAEIFSGAGGTTAAATRLKLACSQPFDIKNGKTKLVNEDGLTMNTMDLHHPVVRKHLINALTHKTPRVIFAAPPCTNWCKFSRCNLKRNDDADLTRRRQREIADWIGPLTKLFREVCPARNTFFMIEQPQGSAMLTLKPMQKLLAMKSTHVIEIDQCRFGREERKATVFVTNIPLVFCGPLMHMRCDHDGRHPSVTQGSRTAETAEYPPALSSALADVFRNAAAPRNISIAGHVTDPDTLLRTKIAYSQNRVMHRTVLDSGCTHSMINDKEWSVLSRSGEYVRATSWCKKELTVPLGTACARTTTASGVPVLLVLHNVGLTDQRSLLDPYQIEANGWSLQLTKHPTTPVGMAKSGLTFNFSFDHDIALDTTAPSPADIALLPRVELTSTRSWSRQDYCLGRLNTANVHDVQVKKEQLLDVPDEYYDLILSHKIAPTKFPWMPDNVRSRMEKATLNLAFSGRAHRGVGKLQHRHTRPAGMSFKRLRDVVATDTGFSTVKSVDGYDKFQLFTTTRTRLMHYVPLRAKGEALAAFQDFCMKHGCPDGLHSDNAKELKSNATVEFCRKHLILRTFTEPYHSNQNRSERAIQTVKTQAYKLLEATCAPKEEWDHALRYVVAVNNKTPQKRLHWRTPLEASCGNTPDISEFSQFNFYDKVVFRPHGGNFPDDRLQTARYLGPATDQGSEFCHFLRLPNNTLAVSSTVQAASATPAKFEGGDEQGMRNDFLVIRENKTDDRIHQVPPAGTIERSAVMEDNDKPSNDDSALEEAARAADNNTTATQAEEQAPMIPTEGRRVRVFFDDKKEFCAGRVDKATATQATVTFEDGTEDDIDADDNWHYETEDNRTPEPAAHQAEEPRAEAAQHHEDLNVGESVWMSFDGNYELGKVRSPPDANGDYVLAFANRDDATSNIKDAPLGLDVGGERIIEPHEASDADPNTAGPTFNFDKIDGYHTTTNRNGARLQLRIQWEDGTKTLVPVENMMIDQPNETAEFIMMQAQRENPSRPYKQSMKNAIKWAENQYAQNHANAVRINAVKGELNGRPAPGVIQFGNYVPKGVKDAIRADKILDGDKTLSATCKDQRWMKAIEKELAKFHEHKAIHFLEMGQRAPEGYQMMNVHFVFACKSDGTFKARLCANGNRVDSTGVESSMTVIQGHHSRALMTVGRKNGQKIWCSDLAAAYLHAVTEERVYLKCGIEWGPEYEGRIGLVQKCIYGLVGSGAGFHKHVFEQMHRLGFRPSEADPDIWLRLDKKNDVYDYVGFYSDDFLTISHHPEEIAKEIASLFTVKTAGPLGGNSYLGADIIMSNDNYYCSASSYIKEAVERLQREMILSEEPRVTANTPVLGEHHPELDDSSPLSTCDHRIYMRLIGTLNWIVLVGRFDIAFATSSMARFSSAPREGHLADVKRIFAYLANHPELAVMIDPNDHELKKEQSSTQGAELHQKFPYAFEELSVRRPEPKGKELPLTVYVDADHGDDRETRRSRTGLIAFLGNTPIMAKSKRQTSVETSTFSAEFNAARTGAETIIGLRFFLRSIGVPVIKPSRMLGDNEGCVTNATAFKSSLQKKHVAISFLRTREAIASGALTFEHVATNDNIADVFTKPLGGIKFWGIIDRFLKRESSHERGVLKLTTRAAVGGASWSCTVQEHERTSVIRGATRSEDPARYRKEKKR